jgi:hypothetical protein
MMKTTRSAALDAGARCRDRGSRTDRRRTNKRDKRSRFASTGSSRISRVGRKISRSRPRCVCASVACTIRLGAVGPGVIYERVHVGAQLRSRKRRAEYYVGVSAGRRIAY